MESKLRNYGIAAGGLFVGLLLLSAFGVFFYAVTFAVGGLFGLVGGFAIARR